MIEGHRPNVKSLFDTRNVDGYRGGSQVRATWMDAMGALVDGPVNAEHRTVRPRLVLRPPNAPRR